MNKTICGLISATLLMCMLFSTLNLTPLTTGRIQDNANGSSETSTPTNTRPEAEPTSPATGTLNNYNDSNQRSRDTAETTNSPAITLMNGMTVNAWSADAYNSSSFDQSITNLNNTGANWVTFTVFWFMNTSSSNEMGPRPDNYTASDSSLIHAIQKAHGLGMKVSLKPMVDVQDGSWRGTISPSNWTLWFSNYRNFIDYYANFSNLNSVELFVVGTELRSSQSYESEWRKVINETRTRFSGNVTYAANWDSYSIYSRLPQYAVKFWDALDYVGVDGYFPLTNSYSPTVAQLVNAWSYSTASGWWGTGYNWTSELYSTYINTGKRILFTEIGYTSQNGTNTQPWTYVPAPTGIDLQEQADCYQACLEVFKDKAWFMGWFWWDWETNPNAGGSYNTDYTPQNKPAQTILNQYYSTRTVTFQATGTVVPVTVSYTRITGNYTVAGSSAVPVDSSNSITIPYGSNVSFSYPTPVSGGSGIQLVLVSTNPNSPLTNVVSDTTVTGNYKTQYYFAVASPYDSPTPSSGWFDSGSSVTESVTSPTLGPSGTRYVCTGWTGTGSVPTSGAAPNVTFTITQPSSITWNWTAQYLLTVLTDPPGLSPQPTRNPQGEAGPTYGWWYNASAHVALTAQVVIGPPFRYWDVDGNSQNTGTNPVTVTMNTSHTATAHYTTSIHDIAIANVTLAKTVVGRGFSLDFSANVTDQGDYTETCNVTVYANATIISTATNVILTSRNSTNITFTWNTTGFAYGNYTLSAYAWPVPGETNTVNNNCTGGWVIVSLVGDVTGPDGWPDGLVDMMDIGYVASYFLAEPSKPSWNPNVDINGDLIVDMQDIGITASHFLENYP